MAINNSKAAGLAALAGLAYAASRGKKGEDTGIDREDADLGAAMRANSASAPASAAPAVSTTPAASSDGSAINQETGEKYYPGGTSGGSRINQETGETYTLDDTAPAAKSSSRSGSGSKSKSRASSVTSPKTRAGEDVARDMESSSNPLQKGPDAAAMERSRTATAQGAAALAAAQRLGETRAERIARMERDQFAVPSKEDIQTGLETGVGGGVGLRTLSGLAKNLANRGKSYMTPQTVKEIGMDAPRLGMDVPRLGMKKGGVVKMAKGGTVKKFASGGSVSSASRRADGIAVKGKTRGRMC
jgi:hypothetical protein